MIRPSKGGFGLRLFVLLLALSCPAVPLAAQEVAGFRAPAHALALWMEDSRTTYGTRLPLLARVPAPLPRTFGFSSEHFVLTRLTSLDLLPSPPDPIALERWQSPRFAAGAMFADLTVSARAVAPRLPLYVNPLVRPFAAHDSVRAAITPPRRRTGMLVGGLGLRMRTGPEGWDEEFGVNGAAGAALRVATNDGEER